MICHSIAFPATLGNMIPCALLYQASKSSIWVGRCFEGPDFSNVNVRL